MSTEYVEGVELTREEVTSSSQRKLRKAVLAESVSDEWELAKKEWAVLEVLYKKEPSSCACNHEIFWRHIIYNLHTKAQIRVGSCCVEHFGTHLEAMPEAMKRNLRKMRDNDDVYPTMTTVDYYHDIGILAMKDRNFYNSIHKKRNLSPAQLKWKRDIARRVRKAAFSSKDATGAKTKEVRRFPTGLTYMVGASK